MKSAEPTKSLDSLRRDERRKMALEGLNKLIELRAAFGSNNHEVLSCLQGWLNREAQL